MSRENFQSCEEGEKYKQNEERNNINPEILVIIGMTDKHIKIIFITALYICQKLEE